MIFGLGSLAQPALAYNADDFSISLYPSTQTLALYPGDVRDGSINVVNTGKIPIDFSVHATPFQVNSDDYTPDYELVNRYTALASWVQFAESAYHAEPGETVEVKFHIEVPADAVGGGQYAAIMVYTEDSADPNAMLRTASQLAAILYGRVAGEGMNPEGEIVEQTVPNFSLGGPLEITETAYNTGNVDFTVYHAVTIKDLFTGEEVLNSEMKDDRGNNIGAHESIVLPGTSRQDKITWEITPKIGIYQVTQKIIILEETIETNSIVIFCPLWLIFAIIGLVLLLILWIILAVRRHRKKQPQVF